jgi:electron transfer flavoprotein alpha subunit/NAD-dependent dihydropyrimidine dehydrogenase PreA subunit
MISIDAQKCNACGICAESCPFAAITVVRECAHIGESCMLCGACVNVCPRRAITIERIDAPVADLAGYRGVMVFAECEACDGLLQPKRVVYELLAKGRRLADTLGEELIATVLGDDRLAGLEGLCHHGADRVIKCVHPLLKDFSTDGFCAVLSAVIAGRKPSVALYGATANGRELAPRVAARLRLGLTADCTALDIDEQGQLVQTRPAFGGNIMASIIAPRSRPQMATVRPNVFRPDCADASLPVLVEAYEVTLNKAGIRTRVVQELPIENHAGPNLEAAKIIVAVGRGCCRQDDLDLARRLAEQLGGVLAGSRPLVEEGLLPHTRQVGQSGITVGPDLYIAIGISGAIQHVVGMNASKTIIAINPDPQAPIFKVADLGIVGNARQIIPFLLRDLETAARSGGVHGSFSAKFTQENNSSWV